MKVAVKNLQKVYENVILIWNVKQDIKRFGITQFSIQDTCVQLVSASVRKAWLVFAVT